MSNPSARPSHRGPALALIMACQLIVLIDATVVTVALPDIRHDLRFSVTGLSWVQDAYLLALGGLLPLGGRSGDVFGRRRVLLAGVAVFTLASLLGGLASQPGWLLATRAAQGVAAAFIAPGTLALLTATFPEGSPRNRALGVYSAVSGAGLVIGLTLGGLLTQASWRWVMFINVPIGAAVLLFGRHLLPEPERHRTRLDLPGALTSTIGVAALVYGLIRIAAGHLGDVWTTSALLLGAAGIAGFLAIEARADHPLVPLRLFGNRNRAAAYANMLLVPAAMFAMFFFLTQFLQDVRHFGPLRTGVAFLPLALAQLAAARTAPVLLPRVGPKPVTVTGTVLLTGGLLWLTRLTADTGYLAGLFGPMLLFGVGVGLCFMPLNMVIVSGLPAHQAGAASGVLQSLQNVGGALGLAALVTVFSAAGQHTSPHGLAHAIATAFTAGTILTACAIATATFVITTRPAPAPTCPPTPNRPRARSQDGA